MMKLLVIILNRPEKLEEILEGFIEIGITGATIIDSVGMGHIISQEVPIFAGLRHIFVGAKPYNKTIFSVVKEEKIELAIEVLEKILGNLNEKGKGIVFVIPIEKVIGFTSEI